MREAMQRQVRGRLHDEAGIHATESEVAGWSEPQLFEATHWMDALLRRKEGKPFAGDTYEFPAHVRSVVQREAA